MIGKTNALAGSGEIKTASGSWYQGEGRINKTITGLDFTPVIVIVYNPSARKECNFGCGFLNESYGMWSGGNGSYTALTRRLDKGGFYIYNNYYTSSGTYYWIAYGM